MKALFASYKPAIKFIVTFLGVYLVLTLAYKYYLKFSTEGNYYPDCITNLVGLQSSELLSSLGYDAWVMPHNQQLSLKLIVNNVYVARIVEGCNAISVIILFVAFVIAFPAKQFKTTLLYVFAGIVLIYVINLLRIVLLAILLYKFPEKSEFMHSVVFPGIIYGFVFLLWVFWVNRFSKLNRSHETSD